MQTVIRPNIKGIEKGNLKNLDETVVLDSIDPNIESHSTVALQSKPRLRFLSLLVSGLIVGIAFAFVLLLYVRNKDIVAPDKESIQSQQELQSVIRDEQAAIISAEEVVGTGEKTIDESLILDLGIDAKKDQAKTFVGNNKIKLEQRKFIHSAGIGSGKIYAPNYVKPEMNDSQAVQDDSGPIRLKASAGQNQRFHDGNTRIEWQSGFHADNPKQNIKIGKAYQGYIKDNFGKPMVGELSSFEKGPGNILDSVKGSTHGPKVQ